MNCILGNNRSATQSLQKIWQSTVRSKTRKVILGRSVVFFFCFFASNWLWSLIVKFRPLKSWRSKSHLRMITVRALPKKNSIKSTIQSVYSTSIVELSVFIYARQHHWPSSTEVLTFALDRLPSVMSWLFLEWSLCLLSLLFLWIRRSLTVLLSHWLSTAGDNFQVFVLAVPPEIQDEKVFSHYCYSIVDGIPRWSSIFDQLLPFMYNCDPLTFSTFTIPGLLRKKNLCLQIALLFVNKSTTLFLKAWRKNFFEMTFSYYYFNMFLKKICFSNVKFLQFGEIFMLQNCILLNHL